MSIDRNADNSRRPDSDSTAEIDLSDEKTPEQILEALLEQVANLDEDQRLDLVEHLRLSDPVAAAAKSAEQSGRSVVTDSKQRWEAFIDSVYQLAVKHDRVLYLAHLAGSRPDQAVKLMLRLAELGVFSEQA